MKKLLPFVLAIGLMLAILPFAAAEESSLYELLKTAPEFDATCERLFAVSPRSLLVRTAQGGCSDGTHHYQAFIYKDKASNEEKNPVIIVKTDMATGEMIAKSELLSLNHSNDLAYNSKTNQIVVCHNNPHNTRISFLDAETLTLVESKELPCSIYCIDYNALRDLYVVGLSGGQTFRYLRSDLTFADDDIHHPNIASLPCVTQGMVTSDDLIAFVLWKPNMISLFDWDGTPLTIIHLNGLDMIEPENICIIDDQIYISCLVATTAVVYKVNITAK